MTARFGSSLLLTVALLAAARPAVSLAGDETLADSPADAIFRSKLTVAEAKGIIRELVHRQRSWEILLPNLTTLDPDVAEALAKPSGFYRISLPAVQSLSPETARALALRTGDLDLPAISSLPPDTAAAFARHRGLLELAGLKTIDADLAAALARHSGHLCLSGLAEMTP